MIPFASADIERNIFGTTFFGKKVQKLNIQNTAKDFKQSPRF